MFIKAADKKPALLLLNLFGIFHQFQLFVPTLLCLGSSNTKDQNTAIEVSATGSWRPSHTPLNKQEEWNHHHKAPTIFNKAKIATICPTTAAAQVDAASAALVWQEEVKATRQ